MKTLGKIIGFTTLILLVLFIVSSCGPSQKTVRADGEAIFQNDVYVPHDAVVLDYYQQDSTVAAINGCTGIEISNIYGINRPADEVFNEYVEDLFANDWYVDSWNENPAELPHFYKGDAFVGVYFAIPLDVLEKLAQGESLQTEDYLTIYKVNFSYEVPSSGESDDDCDY